MPNQSLQPMRISPSVASFDVLSIAQETAFISEYFDEIHIDIEDGMAVDGITFGMKMCKGICALTSARTSIHLEVMCPLKYRDEIKKCKPDIVFIQADILDNPLAVIKSFQNENIPVGLAIGDRDKDRDYSEILAVTEHVLISTAFHDDPDQAYQQVMEDFALNLAKDKHLKVWLDGGITLEKYEQLKESGLYAAVMGRAIYQNKEKFIDHCKKAGDF